MVYRDNVEALTKKRGIENPIREEDLRIARLVFTNHLGRETVIDATDMNRGGRLFLEEEFSKHGFQVLQVVYGDGFKEKAAEYFAELWEDAGKGRRLLIDAILHNTRMAIGWKSR